MSILPLYFEKLGRTPPTFEECRRHPREPHYRLPLAKEPSGSFSRLKPPSFEAALGSSPCGSRRCLTCDHVQTGTTIRSTTTGVSYHTCATATCKSSNVIYLIKCRQCHKQYVGKTQNPLHICAEWTPKRYPIQADQETTLPAPATLSVTSASKQLNA